MKGIKKIICRNVLSAGGITLIILITNIIMFLGFIAINRSNKYVDGLSDKISNSFFYDNDKLNIKEKGKEAVEDNFEWAMMLDDDGNVIWSDNLPEDFKLKYTVSDVASFSKWYLNDYPVNVWKNDKGLLVLGDEKNSLWKHDICFPEDSMEKLPFYISIFFITNFVVAILLAFLSGFRFFNALRKIANGVKDIADKKPVKLNIKGSFKELADDVNLASSEIIRQQKIIDKRDNARNNWIIGVSHDIRTPLSMIMGYSSTLENDKNLNENTRKQASIIRSQSEKIKELVNDLNLTVKLEYEMQPLKLEKLNICSIIRKVCVDYLNNMYDGRYNIDLDIEDNSQNFIISGDSRLLERVFNNLIGNSINHNEKGCNISIKVRNIKSLEEDDKNTILIEIRDDGAGFTKEKLEELNNSNELPTGKNHGIGLFIVKQIVQVHKGNIIFDNGEIGARIRIQF